MYDNGCTNNYLGEQARNKRISQCIQSMLNSLSIRNNNNICQMDVKINISKNKNAEEPEQLKPINNARNKDSKSIILDTINFNSLSPNRREFIHMSPDNLHTFTTFNSRVLNATPSTKNYEEIPWENIMVKNLKQKKLAHIRNSQSTKRKRYVSKRINSITYPEKRKVHPKKKSIVAYYSPISHSPTSFIKQKQKPYSKIFYGNSKFLKSKNKKILCPKNNTLSPSMVDMVTQECSKDLIETPMMIKAKGLQSKTKDSWRAKAKKENRKNASVKKKRTIKKTHSKQSFYNTSNHNTSKASSFREPFISINFKSNQHTPNKSYSPPIKNYTLSHKGESPFKDCKNQISRDSSTKKSNAARLKSRKLRKIPQISLHTTKRKKDRAAKKKTENLKTQNIVKSIRKVTMPKLKINNKKLKNMFNKKKRTSFAFQELSHNESSDPFIKIFVKNKRKKIITPSPLPSHRKWNSKFIRNDLKLFKNLRDYEFINLSKYQERHPSRSRGQYHNMDLKNDMKLKAINSI
ncbi:unnamed protein product [Moneuplotes crassus]|uniref:Uncharacterized protein n=1 Tax=Euplotes crassus TaxID=5936 RepID=A0AAD1U464_EUPCR|nr:unnamed protein product [Moneuplotes crassus]